MLKTVSSITNALGSLNYKGTWNASTNTPTLASGAGTKGDYYVVSVAGTTTLDGISNWGIGDWVTYNGTAWQRVEGGADLNGVNLSVSGTSQLTGNVTLENNLVQGTAAKGINFTANTPAAGMTSQLLNFYEEGTWTPTDASGAGLVIAISGGTTPTYTKIGRLVTCSADVTYPVTANATTARLSMPFTPSATGPQGAGMTSFKSNGTNQFSSVGATGAVFLQVTNAFLTNANLSGVRFATTWMYFV